MILLRGRRKRLTDEQEKRFVEFLRTSPFPTRQCLEIFRREVPDLGHATLARLIERYRDSGELAESRPRRQKAIKPPSPPKRRQGKPRSRTLEEEAMIRKFVRNLPEKNLNKSIEIVEKEFGIKLSYTKMWEIFHNKSSHKNRKTYL